MEQTVRIQPSVKETTPAVADCRLQDTADSPAGMTLRHVLLSILILYIISDIIPEFKSFMKF